MTVLLHATMHLQCFGSNTKVELLIACFLLYLKLYIPKPLTTGSNTKPNYYAFGMAIQGRQFSGSSGYRYGMNGQEKDEEIAQGIYTAEYWEYGSRLGSFFAVDPLAKNSQCFPDVEFKQKSETFSKSDKLNN